MMNKNIVRFCHYNADDFTVVGFYSNEMHNGNIPIPNVVIDLNDIHLFNENQHTHVIVDNGKFFGFKTVDVVITYEAALELAKTNRKFAYKNESDPFYMEWQYEQTAQSENIWRDKVAEIKSRYPLPQQ